MTKISIPGGSGNIPTGAVQFQEDWPGLFLRGDDAIVLGMAIQQLREALKEEAVKDVRICDALLKLGKVADLIERDVRVKE